MWNTHGRDSEGGNVSKTRSDRPCNGGRAERAGGRFQPADLCDRERDRFSSVVPKLDVTLQVDVNEFKDKVQLVVSVDDVEQPVRIRMVKGRCRRSGTAVDIVLHDVIILELLEQADFSNGSARDAFIFCFQSNLLEGDDFV